MGAIEGVLEEMALDGLEGPDRPEAALSKLINSRGFVRGLPGCRGRTEAAVTFSSSTIQSLSRTLRQRIRAQASHLSTKYHEDPTQLGVA